MVTFLLFSLLCTKYPVLAGWEEIWPEAEDSSITQCYVNITGLGQKHRNFTDCSLLESRSDFYTVSLDSLFE